MRFVLLLSLLAYVPAACSTSSSAAGRPVVTSFHRRQLLAASLAATTGGCLPAHAALPSALGPLVEVTDPNTYSALAYAPPLGLDSSGGPRPKPPLLVVLHGAGINEAPITSLADPLGEHAGLAPSLLASGRAPRALADNFAMVAPYAAGKRSFYEEPRRKLLDFVACAHVEKLGLGVLGLAQAARLCGMRPCGKAAAQRLRPTLALQHTSRLAPEQTQGGL